MLLCPINSLQFTFGNTGQEFKKWHMHYVYLLLSEKDGGFYTGSTNDLKRRVSEHTSGNVGSTKNRRPLKLIYYEVYPVKF